RAAALRPSPGRATSSKKLVSGSTHDDLIHSRVVSYVEITGPKIWGLDRRQRHFESIGCVAVCVDMNLNVTARDTGDMHGGNSTRSRRAGSQQGVEELCLLNRVVICPSSSEVLDSVACVQDVLVDDRIVVVGAVRAVLHIDRVGTMAADQRVVPVATVE